MAPPKKANSTRALDYEQLRQENIKRNKEMIASILHQKSQLASLFSPSKPKKSPIKHSKPKPSPTSLRRSMRSRGLPPPVAFSDAFLGSDSWRHLVGVTCSSGERREIGDIKNEVDFGLDARVELGLEEGNVRTVGKGRIVIVRFLPVLNRSIVVSGSEQGSLGFWDADVNGEGDSDGIFVSFPHRSYVSGISVHPSSVEKVKSFDERTGKIINVWEMHEQRVNTIDFHPANSNLVATSSKDGFVRIWDLEMHSTEDTICVWSGPDFENLSIIKHNNKASPRLSSFRAIWGWNYSYIFIGNMQRAIDVISTENNITTPLRSEYMTNVPCRFATHPYKEGLLACAGGGKLFLWKKM